MSRSIKEIVRRRLKYNKYSKDIYECIRLLYAKIVKRKKTEALHDRGNKVIAKIQNLIEKYNATIFFDMGTMLGFVREGRILSYDLDIDLGIIVSSEEEKKLFKQYLIDNGCRLKFSYHVEGLGVVEDSFVIDGIKFDINYYTIEHNKSICYLLYRDPKRQQEANYFDVVKLTAPAICQIKKININGNLVNIPENAEEYLCNRYGEKWTEPDPNYIYYQGPSAEKTNYKGIKNTY